MAQVAVAEVLLQAFSPLAAAITSQELKEWVRRHKDHKYVPPYLLELWGLEVNMDDIAAGAKKPPKRAA